MTCFTLGSSTEAEATTIPILSRDGHGADGEWMRRRFSASRRLNVVAATVRERMVPVTPVLSQNSTVGLGGPISWGKPPGSRAGFPTGFLLQRSQVSIKTLGSPSKPSKRQLPILSHASNGVDTARDEAALLSQPKTHVVAMPVMAWIPPRFPTYPNPKPGQDDAASLSRRLT